MIDLHMHSVCSDGTLTPKQLMEKIAAFQITAAALTDHDVVDGCAEFQKAAADYGIIAVNGSELAVRYPGASMEILALDIPNENLPAFQERQKAMIEERFKVAEERLKLLNNLGVKLSWQDVAFDANGMPRRQIGKPHVVEAMLRLGYIKDWDEGFQRYLNKGCPAYVAKNEPEVKETIAFVLDNGAVPVLAHPVHTKKSGTELFSLISELQKMGLQGIEVFHSDHSSILRRDYLQMAETLKLMASGGSDFHGGAHPGVSLGTGKGDLNIPELVLEAMLARKIDSQAYYGELKKYV